MIEKSFREGHIISWVTQSSQVGTGPIGSIIDSSVISVPTIVEHGPAEHGVFIEHQLKKLGILSSKSFNTFPSYSWLCYSAGYTTKIELSGCDILTGPMSGCAIALWVDGGKTYVGHVGTDYAKGSDYNKIVKDAFASHMPSNATGFYASAVWNDNALSLSERFHGNGGDVFGIVTAAGDFYSILLLKTSTPGKVIVAGIKRVAPMDYTNLKNKLEK